MAKLINTQFESEMEEGDTLHIPQISNLTARAKSAGTDVTFETFTEGVINVSIDKHYYAAFEVEDIVEVQANQDLRARYTDKMGYALGRQMDADLLALYSGLSQSVGVQGTNITLANFLRAVQYLDDADAPAGDRFAVITPAQMHVILNLDDFILQSEMGYTAEQSPRVTGHLIGGQFNPTEVKGPFGMIFGVKVHISNNVQTTGTSPLSYHNLLFQRDAFLLIRQQNIRVQAQYKVESLATDVVADTLYGVSEYRDTFACRILT